MKKGLVRFQIDGAWFLATRRWAMNADEPGLGKTLQALMAIELVGAGRIGVICPASVVYGWWEQIHDWMDPVWRSRFVIGSYNRAVTHPDEFRDCDVLIPDEGHFMKTAESRRTQAILGEKGIARSAEYVWPLTGTPVPNRPFELYPVMSTLAAPQLGPYQTKRAFGQRYCGATYNGHGMEYNGATHIPELKERLSNFMIRRTVDEVLPQLPPAVPQLIKFEMTKEDRAWLLEVEAKIENREEYISTIKENFSQLGDNASLLRATGMAKVRFSVQFVKDKLETVDKVVVFAWHRDVIDRLKEALKDYNPVVHQGGLSLAKKEENKRRFIEDDRCRVFIANIGSAGTGLNGLQKVCNTGVFCEIVWGPGTIGQAVRRLRRIGMDIKQRVNIFLINAIGSYEDAVFGSNERKKAVIQSLVGVGGI